jgi:hypothetical protein
MDEKVLESLTALLHNQFTTQLLWTALLSLAAAGLGAYFGAYLGKKAERRAEQEAFAGRLQEEITKTFETEKVKDTIADASGRAMERLRTHLQREVAFVTFQRDLIARHQDALISALKDCSAIAELAKYEWREEDISTNRTKMTSCLHNATLSAAMLLAMNAIPRDVHDTLATATDDVSDRWDKVLSLKFSNTSAFRNQVPNAPKPTVTDFSNAQAALDKSVSTMRDRAIEAITLSVVPK